jgi:hypothetical protein
LVQFRTDKNKKMLWNHKRMFRLHNSAYCLIKSYCEDDGYLINSNANDEATKVLKFHFKRFFISVKIGHLDLVAIENITGRCIQIYKDSKVTIISPVLMLNEHD